MYYTFLVLLYVFYLYNQEKFKLQITFHKVTRNTLSNTFNKDLLVELVFNSLLVRFSDLHFMSAKKLTQSADLGRTQAIL